MINVEYVEERSQEKHQLRQSIRERQPSTQYNLDEYVTLTDEVEPQSYEEAKANSQKKEWLKSIQQEMKSLDKNLTYDLRGIAHGKILEMKITRDRSKKLLWLSKELC